MMLTDHDIAQLMNSHSLQGGNNDSPWWLTFARAVESAAVEDECKHTDSLLTIMGLDYSRCRSEGGTLMPRKVLTLLAEQRASMNREEDMGTPKTDPDYEHSEAALREADAFDAWMRSVNQRHQPTDDGVETRLLRKCWKAANESALIALREWAVNGWRCEVQHRPMVNIHRRSLDDVWRQVMRYAGLDPDEVVGPSHDALLAAGSAEMERRDALGPWEDRA